MIRVFCILIISFLGWSSPQFRFGFANFLRNSADFIDPEANINSHPKHFQIPNPFYNKVKEELRLNIRNCSRLTLGNNEVCHDGTGVVYRSYDSEDVSKTQQVQK